MVQVHGAAFATLSTVRGRSSPGEQRAATGASTPHPRLGHAGV